MDDKPTTHIVDHTHINKMIPANKSTYKTERNISLVTIKKNKVLNTYPNNSEPPTPYSDNKFRSTRYTVKIFDLPTKNPIKSSPNCFTLLSDNTVINNQEMPTSNNDNVSISQIENHNNHNIQSKINDSTSKISLLFITNI